MKIRITKKGKILLFVILGIIVLGSGGYLLWRVLQPDTIAPTDSDAVGGNGSCCIESIGCSAGYTCKDIDCYDCENPYVGGYGESCGTNSSGASVNCRSSFVCDSSKSSLKCCPDPDLANPLWTCVEDGDDEPPTEGDCQNFICEWPYVVMSGRKDENEDLCRCETCSKVDPDDPWSCEGNPPSCTPPSCPTGYESCGTSVNHESGSNCVKYGSLSCVTHHPDCNNPSYTFRYCKEIVEVPPSCGDGILGNTQGEVCDPPGSSCTDTNGGTSTCTSECTCPVIEIDGYCGDGVAGNTLGEICDPPGSSCTDTNGNTSTCTSECTCPAIDIDGICGDGILGNTEGEQCELGNPTGVSCMWDTCNQTECTCPEVETNPDWDITKVGVESCVEQGEVVEGNISYTITVTNTGDAQGSIDKIMDVLDSKVLEGYVFAISSPGTFSNGQITWELEGEDEIFDIDESQTYTYYIRVPSTALGTYENIVTAYPTEGDSLSAIEIVELDCEIPDIPQTGIFDNSIGRVVAGALLILIGIILNKTDLDLKEKILYSVKEYASEKRIRNFEKKVRK